MRGIPRATNVDRAGWAGQETDVALTADVARGEPLLTDGTTTADDL